VGVSEPVGEEIRAHMSRMDERTREAVRPFLSDPPADKWIRDVLFAYWHYFLLVLKHGTPAAEAEDVLLSHLAPLVPETSREDLDAVEEALEKSFRARGYSFLGGYTLPYRGPYIWRKTEKRVFQVELPSRRDPQPTSVFFMYDFVTLGWKHFETFGAQSAGGWAKWREPPWEDGLYCVSERYDLERLEENSVFQVSLLKHEAQHLADKAEFPLLDGTSLEYSAKLVELIYNTSVDGRLKDIIRIARDAPEDPHVMSSYRILGELSESIFGERRVRDEGRWRDLDYVEVREAARGLLTAHTLQLRTGNDS